MPGLGTKDRRERPRPASPRGRNPPGAPGLGWEAETLTPNLPKLGGLGRARKVPRYLRGHKGQIHGVTAAARARVLAAAAAAAVAAGPAASTAGWERAGQRAGVPEPCSCGAPLQPLHGRGPPGRSAPSARAELSPPDRYPAASPECGSGAPLHVTTPSPGPRAGPAPRSALATASRRGQRGEPEASRVSAGAEVRSPWRPSPVLWSPARQGRRAVLSRGWRLAGSLA